MLFRRSGCSPDTIRRALRCEPILTKPAAQRLSDATGGAVSVEELMRGGVRATPQRKASRAARTRTNQRARRKTSARTAQKAAA